MNEKMKAVAVCAALVCALFILVVSTYKSVNEILYETEITDGPESIEESLESMSDEEIVDYLEYREARMEQVRAIQERLDEQEAHHKATVQHAMELIRGTNHSELASR